MDYSEKVEGKNRYSFCVRYQGTVENSLTHKRFQELAQKYDNVYISTLRVLLDSYDERKDIDNLLSLIDELSARVAVLEARSVELEDELDKKAEKKVLRTFGQ